MIQTFLVIKFLLAIISTLSFVWIVIGMPIGIIIFIFYLLEDNKDKKRKLKAWALRSFGGIFMLVIIILFYVVLSFLEAMIRG